VTRCPYLGVPFKVAKLEYGFDIGNSRHIIKTKDSDDFLDYNRLFWKRIICIHKIVFLVGNIL
jgi:hypothetical protein